MKSDWQRVRLGEIAEVLLGKMLDHKKNRGEPMPFLNNVAVRWGSFDLDSIGMMPFEPDEIERYQIKRGDIVVCEGGECGRCAIWKDEKPIQYQKALHRVRAKKDVDQNFIYYQLNNIFKSGQADALMTGSTIKHLPRQNFVELTMLLPPLVTQRRIAAVLSSLDDKIELNRKMNANLEAQAQALFKSWFVDFEPWGGKMPAGWKKGKLSEIAEITMGQSPAGSDLNAEGDGVVFYQGRTEFTDRFPGIRLYTTAPKRMAKKDDVLISVRAPVGDLNIAGCDCCIGRGIASARSKWQHFLYYALQTLKPRFDIFNGAGTVFGCINKDALNGMEILVPDERDLIAFENSVKSLDALYANNCFESRKLAELRDALLPKLMSGELEVAG